MFYKRTDGKKWQERDRPSFPDHQPPWRDCLMDMEGSPCVVWLQCEYRLVDESTKSERY